MPKFMKAIFRGNAFFFAASLAADMAVAKLYGQRLNAWCFFDIILIYGCAYYGWREDDKS